MCSLIKRVLVVCGNGQRRRRIRPVSSANEEWQHNLSYTYAVAVCASGRVCVGACELFSVVKHARTVANLLHSAVGLQGTPSWRRRCLQCHGVRNEAGHGIVHRGGSGVSTGLAHERRVGRIGKCDEGCSCVCVCLSSDAVPLERTGSGRIVAYLGPQKCHDGARPPPQYLHQSLVNALQSNIKHRHTPPRAGTGLGCLPARAWQWWARGPAPRAAV